MSAPTDRATSASSSRIQRGSGGRRLALGLGVGVALLVTFGVLYARHVGSSRRAAEAAATLLASEARGDPVLRVPHLLGPITLDGDMDDLGWVHPPGPARTGEFLVDNGRPARPISAARLVWGGDYLYLALFASDEDIESHVDQPDDPNGLDDAFRIVFSEPGAEYAIEVSPEGIITDAVRLGEGPWDFTWSSGAHASRELDGTVNFPNDLDEEWAIELAIPFESIGMRGEPGENIGMSLSRCDTPKDTLRVCAGWGEGALGHSRGRIVLE